MKGGSPQESAPAPAAKARISPELQAKAKKLYELDCAMCHGDKGDGKTDIAKSMNVTLDDWSEGKALAGKSDDALFDTIRKGKGNMPAEAESRANDALVRNLIHYIRGLSKGSAEPVHAAQ
jgi:mono/diheme cytochrome c family protein